MIWLILTILLAGFGCYLCYKKGKIAAFNSAASFFKEYKDKMNPTLHDILSPGLEAAEHLIDQLKEKESIWE